MPFANRHIGPSPDDIAAMCAAVGVADPAELVDRTVPTAIRNDRLDLPAALSEVAAAAELAGIAARNTPVTSLIGLGYHGTHTPAVIRRQILENPAWYTAYTPYQPEISQGRLEMLINFQTMISDLVAMPITNASLLDEATAVAEAMTLMHRQTRGRRSRFLLDADAHPQTVEVVVTRAEPLDIEVVVGDPLDVDDTFFGVLAQYPGSGGSVRPLGPIVEAAHAVGALAGASADLLACVLLEAPGEAGVDVVVGTTQRFGVPMAFGGPHAAFMSVRDDAKRAIPGRLVGASVDDAGRPGYRLALATREQHIRREKATSNICTAQVLLAVIAAAYAIHHGPDGLRAIARRVHDTASRLAGALVAAGWELVNDGFFDTLTVRRTGAAEAAVEAAAAVGIDLRPIDADTLALAIDETVDDDVLTRLAGALGVEVLGEATVSGIPPALARSSDFLAHPVFNSYHAEHELLRYLRRLADKDIALDRTMIPLGSCTMKLNAAASMEPITWPAFAALHPYGPPARAEGYARLVDDLEGWLAEITGYDAVSLQPNSGAQGEYAGLLAIRAWHRSRGDDARDVCLIPASAHGTNPASAALAGMRVVVVATDDDGNVDVDDLRTRLAEHAERVAALMITYPSTHGVFEEAIVEICDLVHDVGGQVYLDGANLNAMVGVAKPGKLGADVSHLNLHKTFTIPHGGGGPGVGPIGVRAHLAPFLPGRGVVGPVSAAPQGSAGILPIPWMYLRMMGADGLRRATEVAILAANYVAARLGDAYPVLYRGSGGTVAHECILDLRDITAATGVTVDDVAKRLMDHGYHAPTMSFPVAGTLMIEPTESESLAELDRFCDAMLAIRAEIADIEAGRIGVDDSPLRHAPHTAEELLAADWDRPYTREQAAFPTPAVRADKYWPPVGRIDGGYGDRNLVCTCLPVEAYR